MRSLERCWCGARQRSSPHIGLLSLLCPSYISLFQWMFVVVGTFRQSEKKVSSLSPSPHVPWLCVWFHTAAYAICILFNFCEVAAAVGVSIEPHTGYFFISLSLFILFLFWLNLLASILTFRFQNSPFFPSSRKDINGTWKRDENKLDEKKVILIHMTKETFRSQMMREKKKKLFFFGFLVNQLSVSITSFEFKSHLARPTVQKHRVSRCYTCTGHGLYGIVRSHQQTVGKK